MLAKVISTLVLLCAIAAPARANQIFPYVYFKMDIPKCVSNNELTGIDNLGQVVGFGCNPSIAFSSGFPGYTSWNNIGYPGAASSEVFKIDNTFDKAGEYYDANGNLFGYLRRKGATYEKFAYPVFDAAHIHCGPTGGHHCHGHQNESDLFAVGGNGLTGYQIDVDTGATTTLSIPGSSYTVATGYNEQGDTCGNYDGGIWILQLDNPNYTTFTPEKVTSYGLNPAAAEIFANGLNWQKQIVGYYYDSSGNVHGFILTYPNSKKPVAQTINAHFQNTIVTGTVLEGNNDHGDIVGYWLDEYGNPHGFLGERVKAKSA